jgi:isochorismate synthase
MSIIRLRLPKTDLEKSAEPSRTFVVRSEFRGEINAPTSDEGYAAQVEQAISQLKDSNAKKIVLSRILPFKNEGNTVDSIFSSFNQKFPNAAVFAFTDENNAQWVGATPELLFRKRGSAYSTISLAGTRKSGSPEEWGNKEVEEQRLVTEFIQHELKALGAENIQRHDLHTRNAGSIEHLCNEITFEYNGHWKNVMDTLHPTPAICGLPREKAKELIKKIEQHDREYYTGLIGLEQGEDVDVYVILRCLKFNESTLNVFVGAGITVSSVPELEARETRWKAESLTDVIF